jgi:hypothetical protein
VRRAAAALLCLLALACARGGRAPEGDYLKYVAFRTSLGEPVLLRWQARQMPLRVYLPPPPAGIADDPEAVLDAVRDGFMDWTDAAGPGVPSFEFVATQGEADIPVAWEPEPKGDWFIAHCVWDIDPRTQRFGVARILATTRGAPGAAWSLDLLYVTMLHEVGHALGLRHSPDRGDIMFPSLADATELSARDRATIRRLYSLPIGHRVVGARSADD